jgi:hypothetical protein
VPADTVVFIGFRQCGRPEKRAQSVLSSHSAQPSAVQRSPAAQSALEAHGLQVLAAASQVEAPPVHSIPVLAHPTHRSATHRSPAVKQSICRLHVPAGRRWHCPDTQSQPPGHGEYVVQESVVWQVCVAGLQRPAGAQSACDAQETAPDGTHWYPEQIDPVGQSPGPLQPFWAHTFVESSQWKPDGHCPPTHAVGGGGGVATPPPQAASASAAATRMVVRMETLPRASLPARNAE